MSSHVGVYFDADGNVTTIVCPHFDEPGYQVTEKDFAPHDFPGLTRVTVAADVYRANPPVNNGGQALYFDLAMEIVADLAKSDAIAAGKLVTKIQDFGGKLAVSELPDMDVQAIP